jgi:16S rRNA (guanine966-N2)-methyltransferase
MRIIAGTAGGRRLAVPPEGTRPTTDRVREALFSSLDTHVRIDHGDWNRVRVLDLFAGSGAVGLEALSRGAAGATLVERDRRCLEVLRANVATVDPRARVVAADAFAWVPDGGPFDLAYIDPPYAVSDDDVRRLLEQLSSRGAFADDALIVVERSQRSSSPWPGQSVEPLRERAYGDTRLWYGRASLTGEASSLHRATATAEEEA